MGDTVAVIGLGGMGGGMAHQLLAKGYAVRVWNRSPAAADALVAAGAVRAETPADAVEPGGSVITMVANDAALDSVARGPDGFLARLGGGLHISTSTIGVALARDLAAAHAAVGGEWLAAPVFGRPEAAASGKLWVMVSGTEAAKGRGKPILADLSQGVFDLGVEPDGAVAGKIAGNFLIASAMEAMAEAFALLEKRNVDARAFHAMISQTILASPIYANYGRFILDKAFTPPGFKLALGAKDVGLALAAGQESDVPMPFASLLRDRFLTAMARGQGEMDWTSIALGSRTDAGLE